MDFKTGLMPACCGGLGTWEECRGGVVKSVGLVMMPEDDFVEVGKNGRVIFMVGLWYGNAADSLRDRSWI
jgi:hypothetical protein